MEVGFCFLATYILLYFLNFNFSAECYYCANGSTNDILKLVEVYGAAELRSDAFAQSTRSMDPECGKNSKKSMKVGRRREWIGKQNGLSSFENGKTPKK